ncbi:MAG: hypothetical protein AAF962_16495 [Actinomycetota bacterium]
MRGTPDRQLSMLSSLSAEDLIPADHPARHVQVVVDEVLAGLDVDHLGLPRSPMAACWSMPQSGSGPSLRSGWNEVLFVRRGPWHRQV